MLLADRIDECINVVQHQSFELCDVGSTEQLTKDPPPFRVLFGIPILCQPYMAKANFKARKGPHT